MEYLVGSKALGLKNARDEDYVIIATNKEYERRVEKNKEYIYISENLAKEIMSFDVRKEKYKHLYLFNYQFDRKIIGDSFPISYNILEYKGKLKELLKRIMEEKLYNFDKRVTTNGDNCSKRIYHIAYNVFILENNSSVITKEQKEIIQTIHDCKMPIDYLDELKIKIKEIKI